MTNEPAISKIGTGGPRSRRAVLAMLAIALGLALWADATLAAKGGDSFIGAAGAPASGTGADGGAFNGPRGVAVNQDTGQIFVVDRVNQRIQRLNADGDFELAWGRNVSESATSGDDAGSGGFAFEVCVVAADCQGGSSAAAVGGYAGSRGGMFNNPHGVAVDPDTGDVYVTDVGNRRVQRFSFDENGTPGDPSDDLPVFESAWGSNTVPLGGTGNAPGPSERQQAEIHFSLSELETNVSGSFSLVFDGQTTSPIVWPPTEASLQAALDGLANLAPGDAAVSGLETVGSKHVFALRWTVDYGGAYANLNVPLLGIDKSNLEADGFITPRVVAVVEGDSNYEVCTVASECQAGVAGQTAGAFGSDSGNGAIAVRGDGTAAGGAVFVGDPGNRRMVEMAVDGAFARTWGYGVDSGAAAFEICTIASGCQEARNGSSAGGAFSNGSPGYIAVDQQGVVYAIDDIGLMRFDSTVIGNDDTAASALLLPPLEGGDPPTPSAPLREGTGVGLEVDPANGNLLYLVDGTDTVVQELDVSSEPPVEVDVHMGNADGQTFEGLGVMHGPHGNKLLASASGGVVGHRLLVLDEDGAGPITLSVEPPTGIGTHEAMLNGVVNAGGPTTFAADHEFQYSTDGVAWTAVPASDGPFSDGIDHDVDDTVEGLEANTAYQVRLAGTRLFNGRSAQLTPSVAFSTLATTPIVETLQTSLRTDTSATLIGRLNPEGSPTQWHFEYGLDESYGQATPVQVATGGKSRLVKVEVEGLSSATAYHYRLVADNGQEQAPGDTVVEGGDVTVTTRPALASDPLPCPNAAARIGPSAELSGCRAYELVSPPFKIASLADKQGQPNLAIPSLDGDSLAWRTAVFPISQEVQAPGNGDSYVSVRGAGGWVSPSLNTLRVRPPFIPPGLSFISSGSSGDLRTLSWNLFGGDTGGAELLPNDGTYNNRLYTRRTGTGTNGFTGWIANTDTQVCAFFDCAGGNGGNTILNQADQDDVLLDDDGSAMARWGSYREIAEDPATAANEDPSGELQLPGDEGGRTLYLQRVEDPDALPASAKVLAGVCTGAGPTATRIPLRQFSGSSTVIGTQSCPGGQLTSRRGAAAGGGRGTQANQGPAATALSNDGNRLFFQSPDPEASGLPASGCTTDTGASTNCVPQLYVRQYNDDGDAVVRWISRSRSVADGEGGYGGATIANQRIAELGAGTVFEGASRSGDVVYFKTNAPLTPDDPNGGVSITAGSASDLSWDLYRYELPSDRSQDPDGGVLTRVSGGPAGTADPSTNRPEGDGGALRFHSDDGRRAYFVTTSPLAGADSTPPLGGTTSPGGAVGNNSIRNLYLFDGEEAGPDRYRFVASLDSGGSGNSGAGALRICATHEPLLHFSEVTSNGTLGKCLRGTPDGEHVVFLSAQRLTEDDDDDAVDVFLYDAAEDELTRVTAPPPGSAPYQCDAVWSCNGELNQSFTGVLGSVAFLVGPFDGARGWRGTAYLNVAEDATGAASVFFESRLPLVPEDVNGSHADVYEWREGEVSLLSPGTTPDDAHFAGNSLDGEDAFLFTPQRIDPRELSDQDYDYYDVRRGGGFPYAPPPEPCDVLALACEQEALPVPPSRSAATTTAVSSGNVTPRSGRKPPKCRKGKVRRKGRCLKRRKAGRAAGHGRRADR